ncbi:MAG: DUF1697 domain-containing protein [Actinobacteria bacterium]|nr:DUF1697 domain-containing protein [Actinomycetota bacterium]
MNRYIAFLRGINVGGNTLIKMAELKDALTAAGLAEVRTYIQSGNVIFSSDIGDADKLASSIRSTIRKRFSHKVDVAVFTADEWQRIIAAAPDWWGVDPEWKHNLLITIKPFDMKDVVEAIGELKPDIEAVEAGDGVLYQSLSLKYFGRTNTGRKLVSNPVYKKMTIRNYNTATKLGAMLAE